VPPDPPEPDAAGASAAEGARSGGLPPWLQAQTVRLVLSGLMTVYFVGLLYDLRGNDLGLSVEVVVLALVALLFLLTVLWWNPTGGRATRPHARMFLLLAGLALLVQVVAVGVESSETNDLANNAANLLLLVVLLLNTLG
jgi:hypothetical protein